MVSVYVSYAWREEEQNRLVDRLGEACRARGIELVRDTEHIGYGQSIRAFMDKLAQAEHIVLVLSDAYFRSDYCMYELCGIHQDRHFADFRKRVYPIILRGTHLYKPVERIQFVKHWIAEAKQLEQELNGLEDCKHTLELRRSLEDYADFHRLIDKLMNVLADMNSLTEDVHRDTDFAALLDRIKGNAEVDDFRRRIVAEVRVALGRSARLRDALEDRLCASGASRASDTAEALCARTPDKAIADLLFPATLASLTRLDEQRKEFSDAWASAKSVLAWLTLLGVDGESFRFAQRQALAARKLAVDIGVRTTLGVEMVTSHYREVEPRLRLHRSNVVGAGAVQLPQYESGWNATAVLNNLLLETWSCVFPEESRSHLEKEDRDKLKGELAARRELKTFHHYILVPRDQQTLVTQPEFQKEVLDALGNVSVIVFQAEGAAPALLLSDEYYFMGLVRQFLTIPELLAKPR